MLEKMNELSLTEDVITTSTRHEGKDEIKDVGATAMTVLETRELATGPSLITDTIIRMLTAAC